MDEYEKARFYIDIYNGINHRHPEIAEMYSGIAVAQIQDLSKDEISRLWEEFDNG